MLLTLEIVQRQLIRLFNHFPGHGRTISNLEIIAPDYHEIFKGMYGSEFICLVDVAIQEQGRSFFPTIGDLKKIELNQRPYNPYGGSGGLPYVKDMPIIRELTEAEAKVRKSDLAKITKNIGKKM